MTWLLHENLIDGELDNQFAPLSAGWVSGWMRLYRRGQAPLLVNVWLRGDFHIDIEGKILRLKNPKPRENAVLGRTGTYLEGFSPVQVGSVDCITVGLPEPDRTKQNHRLKIEKEREWDRLELPVAQRVRRRAMPAAKLPTRSDENGVFQPCAPHPYLMWSSIGLEQTYAYQLFAEISGLFSSDFQGQKSPLRISSAA